MERPSIIIGIVGVSFVLNTCNSIDETCVICETKRTKNQDFIVNSVEFCGDKSELNAIHYIDSMSIIGADVICTSINSDTITSWGSNDTYY